MAIGRSAELARLHELVAGRDRRHRRHWYAGRAVVAARLKSGDDWVQWRRQRRHDL
jgi:hypothetical protein